jgi:signal transduction histidine kinase
VRRVPIRMKLAGALAVPLVALVLVTVFEVTQTVRNAARVREQNALAQSSLGPVSLLSVLENERNAAAVYLLDQQEAFALPVNDNDEARADVDNAIAEFRSEIESQGGEIAEAYGPALARLSALADLRAEVDAAPAESLGLANIDAVSTNFDGYTEVMDDLFEANSRVALAVDDPDLRRGAELIDLSARQTNLLAILVRDLLLAQVGGTNPDGVNTPQEISTIASRLGELRDNERLIATKASTGTYRSLAEDLLSAEEIQRFPEIVEEALETGQVDLEGVITYSAGDDPETFGYTVFRYGVAAELDDKADELEAAAAARRLWFGMLVAVSLGVAVAVTWLVSRSITKPLRSLTRQAKDMAERTLPDAVLDILDTPLGDDVTVPSVQPVQVNTRDEVSDVADALNTVQDTALELAVEQAVLRRNIADSFVNLGRRNQNLLGRQLDFITELETSEADPDTLANLFRLDHLATRMRRNAESLLVLAGIEPPRQWAAPVRLTDVIRAALGEVEDYQRVTVRGVEPATILGSAAADLAHLLAELIENALVFSPPDQTVDIRGRNRPDGYTLAIIDSGLGMPPNDITAANRRLAGAESFTIAPSKYLGHYVAGNLAARHNINVHLDNSPGNGITATIDIPPTLLTTDDVRPQANEPHAARDVWPPAPSAPAPEALAPPGQAPLPARRQDAAPMAQPIDQPQRDWGAPPPADPTQPLAFPRADFSPSQPANGGGARPWGEPPDGGARPWGEPRPGPGEQPSWLAGPGSPSAPAHGQPPSGEQGLARRQPPLTDAEAEARRTASGLVKRTPRVVDTGQVGAVDTGPNDELLASLSRYTNGRDLTGSTPQVPSPPGGANPPLPGRYPAPAQPPAQSPPPGGRPDRPTSPAPAPGAGGGLGGLAAGLGGLPTFRPSESPARETPRAAPGAGPGESAPTSGGLPRRVRGAQLPNVDPLTLRRSSQPPAAPAAPTAPAAPAPAAPPTPRGSQETPSADAVYSFLTNFTAGVQRGLDETRPGDPSGR